MYHSLTNQCDEASILDTSPAWLPLRLPRLRAAVAVPPDIAERHKRSSRLPLDTNSDNSRHSLRSLRDPLSLPLPAFMSLPCRGAYTLDRNDSTSRACMSNDHRP